LNFLLPTDEFDNRTGKIYNILKLYHFNGYSCLHGSVILMTDKHLAADIVSEVKKAVVGKDDVVVKALLAVFARGHILLEDIPGVGKTTLALAFSKALGLSYRRVQFTPDVMPSDLTGFSLYNKATGQMEYQPGALLCNLFLADELNRATSRTQSALLEAMEEGQVTVDGTTHSIPDPFLVIATQNPAGASGTQLLPDSQLDRFALRLSLGYPSAKDELELLRRKQRGNPLDDVRQVLTHQELAQLRAMTDQVYVGDEILSYILRLIRATREHPQLIQGASPRAAIAVTALSRATAFLRGRDFVIPEDVQFIWPDAVAHRLLLPTGAAGSAQRAGQIAGEVLSAIQPPRIR
jgi:MoxR-like ATPase